MYTGGTFTSEDESSSGGGGGAGAEEGAVEGGAAGGSEVDTPGTGTEPPAPDDSWWASGGIPGGFDGSDDAAVTEPSSTTGSSGGGGAGGEPAALLSSGESFNALAAYLLGENDEAATLAMTTPVATDYVGKIPRRMSLVLPVAAAASAEAAPRPTSARVFVSERVPARYAVRAFGGFATEGEVKRQLLLLKSDLAMYGGGMGYAADFDPATGEDLYSVLQYNPPTTLPFLRRNEIAILLRADEDIATAAATAADTGASAAAGTASGAEPAVDATKEMLDAIDKLTGDEEEEEEYDDGYPSD